MNRTLPVVLAIALSAIAPSVPDAGAQQPLAIQALAERRTTALPPGDLFWRIETFATLADAQAGAGPWSLAAESGGKAWLFTLGSAGGHTPGATKVTDVGPVPRIAAPQYLLRINEARGAPGSITKVHSHPGSEAFFVLAGEQTIRGPDGVMRVRAGQAEAGRGADVPMQVSSTGTGDLHALVMFVVDGTRPFSSPAALP
jgi:quercetin dioxygenase-like cupin family protein